MNALPEAVRAFIAESRVCRIAMMRADGEPHLIPVCPVYDGEETVYVDIGPESSTGRALSHEARIAVLFDEYDDDWSKLKKVLLKCRAERVEGDSQERAWEMIRAKYPQYGSVGWRPRATMALRIYAWLQEGIQSPAH